VIRVACAINPSYIPHIGTMLRSCMAHTPGERFEIHVLHGEPIAPEDRRRMDELAAAHGAAARFHRIDDAQIAGFPRRYFPPLVWYRLLLPELLPDADKVLYLDADLLAADSVAPLWQVDVSGVAVGAVLNPLYPFLRDWRAELGLADSRRYFNSGVLLMNLEHLRRTRGFERLRTYASAHPENRYPDQDALNVVLHGEHLLLHPRWNVQTPMLDLRPAQLPFDARELAEARARPALIHFLGPFKPWHYLCVHPQRHLYQEHRRHTPWPVVPLEGRTLENILLRPLPLTLQDFWFRRGERWRGLKSWIRRLLRTVAAAE
jgi:lipopolysaccharide biosynthesis glycosyltransferase